MKSMKNQKSQNFQKLVKKEKLLNFGLNRTKTPKRFFFRRELKGFILYDSLNSEIFFINKTAKKILFLIDKGLKKEDIIKKISKKYKISEKKVSKGVNNVWSNIK